MQRISTIRLIYTDYFLGIKKLETENDRAGEQPVQVNNTISNHILKSGKTLTKIVGNMK